MGKRFFTLAMIYFLHAALAAAAEKPLRYENFIYEERIKTVLLTQAGSIDPLPILKLSAGDQLTLSFDELGTKNDYYQYTFVHCNADWTPSDLQPMQFMEGNSYETIDNFRYSNNTYVKYVNYTLNFPSQNMKLKFSGNYLLKVYRNFNDNDLVLTRRFYVLDNKIGITGNVHPATLAEYRFNRQEVDFVANAKNYQIINPFQDTRVTIIQNYWQDNAITNLKPLFVNGFDLTYNYEEGNVFPGINEFRFFDTRSLRTVSLNVEKKLFEGNMYHAILVADEPRGFKKYTTAIDYDGKRVIDNRDGKDVNIDGDYTWVYFTLRSPNKLRDSVYIMGELTDWRIQEGFKMTYNEDLKVYEGKALLKQGFYDYMYVTQKNSDHAETTFTEGNYMETENDYLIFYYVRNQFFDYYELLGFQRLNSNSGK